MGSFRAERFFEDRQLEAARAIASGDLKRLQVATVGLDLNQPGKTEMTLLWFAIQEKNFEAIRFLVSKGSDPTKQVVQGVGIPIDYALTSPDTRFLAAMLDGGFPVNYTTQYGNSLLHQAAGEADTIAHMKLLVERGADINSTNSIGNTPLCEALYTHLPDRARYLLEHGASLSSYTTRGVTPAYIVDSTIPRLKPGSEVQRQFEALRDDMIQRGAKFPADDPSTVRAWMKTQGMEVDE